MALGATAGQFLGTFRTVRVLMTSCRHSSKNSINISLNTPRSSTARSSVMSAMGAKRFTRPGGFFFLATDDATIIATEEPPTFAVSAGDTGVGPFFFFPLVSSPSSSGKAVRNISATSRTPPLTLFSGGRMMETDSTSFLLTVPWYQ